MRFAYGYTRFVVLVGKRAIKFARIPLLLLLPRLAANIVSAERRKIFRERFGPMPSGIVTFLLRGFIANRHEFRYFQEHPDDDTIMPVDAFIWKGFILIQPRGGVVTSEEFEAECSLDPALVEARKPYQFARHRNGKLLLVDYGHEDTCQLLSAAHRRSAV